jgi:hypothetical protein
MSWDLMAVGTDINFEINEKGLWHARGDGRHYCRPAGGDVSFLRHVEAVKQVSWAIYWFGGQADNIELVQPGLSAFAANHPDVSTGAITFFPNGENPGNLTFTVVTAKDAGFLYYDMLKLLFGKPLRFSVRFKFTGLKVEGATADVPTVGEFTHTEYFGRKSYFTDEVSLQVHQMPEED